MDTKFTPAKETLPIFFSKECMQQPILKLTSDILTLNFIFIGTIVKFINPESINIFFQERLDLGAQVHLLSICKELMQVYVLVLRFQQI